MAPHPKQWNRSGMPPTDSDAVESSWKGQQPKALAPPGQLDTTGRDDGLDRVVASNCRNVKAFAAVQRHSSTPTAASAVVSISWSCRSRSHTPESRSRPS